MAVGFFTLPLEIRDMVYAHCWNTRSTSGQTKAKKVLPFEVLDEHYSPIGLAKWTIDRAILDSQVIAVSKQFNREFLYSLLRKSTLVLAIEFNALDESFEPLGFDELKTPKVLLQNARRVDLKVELIPRWQFLEHHTVESEMAKLREYGENRYIGDEESPLVRTVLDKTAMEKLGDAWVNLRTPAVAYRKLHQRLEPVAEVIEGEVGPMPNVALDEFRFENMDPHVRSRLWIELNNIKGGAYDGVIKRIHQTMEVWGIRLPVYHRLVWLRDMAVNRPEALGAWHRALQADFVVSAARLIDEVVDILQPGQEMKRVRIFLKYAHPSPSETTRSKTC
jgi:hypothetical protein